MTRARSRRPGPWVETHVYHRTVATRPGPVLRRCVNPRPLLILALVLLSTACSMVQPTSAPLGTEQNPLKLALAPSTEPRKVLAAGEPLMKLLERETGLRIKLSVPTSYAATIEAMGTHNVDVGWLAPQAYVLAHDRVGAEVLLANVKGGSTTSTGQIVVRADGGITSLDGLRGTRFAVADVGSAAGYHLPRALLLVQGLDPDASFAETLVAGGDDRVALAVYQRRADGGVVVGSRAAEASAPRALADASFGPLPPDLVEQLRVVARTDPIPNDVVGVRRGVPPELGRKLRDGLLRVAASPAGATALRELYGIDGLGPVTDAELGPLRTAIDLLDLDLDAELAPGRRPT